MSNIPKQWKRSLASIQNFCQTFLSSCCDYNSRNTTSKPPILAHRYHPMRESESNSSFFQNSSDIREAQFKTILPNKITPAKLDLQAPTNNPAPVPLTSLQIEKQNKAISKIIYRPELTPPPSPTLRSMAPSPEPMDPLKKDLENITKLLAGFDLEGERGEIEALKRLGEIERKLITKYRPLGISRSEARQILKIDAKSQNTNHYQVQNQQTQLDLQ
jgi:hypothetical protein